MKEADREICAALAGAARFMAAERLAWGSSGNLSGLAADGESCWMSPSGSWLGELAATDFVRCRLADGASEAGQHRPSKEHPMHRAIYRERPEARWVLHGSPPSTTLFACQHRAPADNLFIEGMAYLADLGWADYAHPGGAELGDLVGAAARRAGTILLKNHGVIAFDRELPEAKMRLLVLEFACALEIAAASSGRPVYPLADDTVAAFRARRVYRPAAPPAGG